MQVQGKDRAEVEEAGRALGLEGTYIPHSYIELVQIGHLTEVGGVAWGGVERCEWGGSALQCVWSCQPAVHCMPYTPLTASPCPSCRHPQSFQTVTEDLKRRFAVNGEPLIDESVVGSLSRGASPHWSAGELQHHCGSEFAVCAAALSQPVSIGWHVQHVGC